MKLTCISITNFRSIKDVQKVRIESLHAFVGENNAGKSNILHAVECFLTGGAGGVQPDDFNDLTKPIMITAEFEALSKAERRKLKTYLIGDKLILQKKLTISTDARRAKTKVTAEYHGYRAEPKDWWLSIKKINEKNEGKRPRWKEIADEYGITEYVLRDGKVDKSSYEAGVAKYLQERDDIEYDNPELGNTQALGIQPNLLAILPEYYLLPAITDYSDEVDRRSSSTVFRRLMADLSDRIMRTDERYIEIEETLLKLRQLLNPPEIGKESYRIEALSNVETMLCETIKKLMPSVQGVQLTVTVDETKDVFSKGVALKVDDGVLTDVLVKGHGLQRSIVFSLLQMLMKQSRDTGNIEQDFRPIILAIEEPELYIHPHAQRLIYRVLKEFAGITVDANESEGTDQVLYTTHSPAFIDVSQYERIAVVRKDVESGTKVTQCESGVLGSPEEKKGFKLLTSFGLKHNEMFFARYCILVEGPEDEIGVIATARQLGRITDLPDELGLSIVVADGKGDIPKFQKVLNAFGFNYGVLLELDGKPKTDRQTKPIFDNLNGNRIVSVVNRLEDLLGVGRHFDDLYHAKQFFSDSANINRDMEELVLKLLPTNEGEL